MCLEILVFIQVLQLVGERNPMAHLLQVSSLYLCVIDISVRISHPLPPGTSWEEKPATLSESIGWPEGGSDCFPHPHTYGRPGHGVLARPLIPKTLRLPGRSLAAGTARKVARGRRIARGSY